MHAVVGKKKHTFLGCLVMSGCGELTLKEWSCIKMCTSTVSGKSLGMGAE